MKTNRILMLAAMALVFTACHKDPTIVGKWQVSNSSVPNYPGDQIFMYEFNEDQTGLIINTENGVTDTMETVWEMTGDTILVLDANRHQSEPIGTPVPYIVEELNKNDMTWLALWGGSFRVYFNRL